MLANTQRTTLCTAAWRSACRQAEQMDWLLLGSAGLLILLGLVFISSALDSGVGGMVLRQLVFAGIGLAAFLVAQRVDYLRLLKWSPLLYGAGLFLLLAVLFTRPINGARSWFNLYVFNLQPSELMKPLLIVTLAHYLMYRDSYKRLTGLVLPMALWFVPLGLILKQPDMGTAMVLVPCIFAMLYAAGARLRHLGLALATGACGLAMLWFTVMKDYQKRRVLAWLNPEEYRLNEAWQQWHAEIAIGSGGFFGRSFGAEGAGGASTLPERHTDFIFAVAAEQGGFAVSAFLLLLLCLLGVAALGVALRTREPAGRLIAVGVATLLCGQALINIGVATGMLPTTGVTLPFVSYGGSSLLSACLCLGLLTNVATRREVVLAREDFE